MITWHLACAPHPGSSTPGLRSEWRSELRLPGWPSTLTCPPTVSHIHQIPTKPPFPQPHGNLVFLYRFPSFLLFYLLVIDSCLTSHLIFLSFHISPAQLWNSILLLTSNPMYQFIYLFIYFQSLDILFWKAAILLATFLIQALPPLVSSNSISCPLLWFASASQAWTVSQKHLILPLSCVRCEHFVSSKLWNLKTFSSLWGLSILLTFSCSPGFSEDLPTLQLDCRVMLRAALTHLSKESHDKQGLLGLIMLGFQEIAVIGVHFLFQNKDSFKDKLMYTAYMWNFVLTHFALTVEKLQFNSKAPWRIFTPSDYQDSHSVSISHVPSTEVSHGWCHLILSAIPWSILLRRFWSLVIGMSETIQW